VQLLKIDRGELSEHHDALRSEVRAFLKEELNDLPASEKARSWNGFSAEFSRALGKRGWLGMTWPKRYGGGERSPLDRHVVIEELLAAGAPVAAHWGADRQCGPLLIKYSPETLAPKILPEVAKGECFICIGMSEPDSGSDLASVRTKATYQNGHWVVNGQKVWTTNAHRSHYMITLVRTGSKQESRHAGLSQMLIDMRAPGVTVRPIINMLGDHEFNEVILDDVRVPEEFLVGQEGNGWEQASAELTLERAGPERYISSIQLMLELLAAAKDDDARHQVTLGRAVARYSALQEMSLGVAGMLADGRDPAMAATLVKDQGALLEQSMPELAHELFGGLMEPDTDLFEVANYLVQATPSYSLRGGTREILRGILAKGMGLR